MSELSNQVMALSAKVAGAKSEMKIFNQRALNSISIIRSRLDPLQLDENEDATDLNITAASVEMEELQSTIDKMMSKKEYLSGLEKELKNISKKIY